MKYNLGVILILFALAFVGMLYGGSVESGSSGGHSFIDDECPYCGSGDTDGNHCYDCNEDL